MADEKTIYFKVELQGSDIAKQAAKEMEEALKRVNEERRKLKKEDADALRAVKELAAAEKLRKREILATQNTIEGMRAKLSKYNEEWVKMDIGSDAWKKHRDEIALTKRELDKYEQSVGNFTRNVGNYPQAFAQVTSGINGLGAVSGAVAAGPLSVLAMVIGGIASQLGGMIKNTMEFQSSLANLRAIVGVSKEELVFFSEAAKLTSLQTGIAAKDVVESYKLLASANSDLLKNKEALVEVSEAAITLSKASGLTLPDATQRLIDTMGQMNIHASQAAKTVDILAAASQAGAAEVPDLSESLLQFGSVAFSVNADVKESAALIETLAKNGIKGAEAGTVLRNILLKMSAPDALGKDAQEALKKYGVSIETITNNALPLGERLKELQKIAGDNAAMVKVFRLENVTAANVLLNNLPVYEDFKNKVSEIGVAQKQAAINTDTAAAKWDKFGAQVSTVMLGDGGVLTSLMDGLTGIMDALTGMDEAMEMKRIKQLQKESLTRLFDVQAANKKLGETQTERIKEYIKQMEDQNKKSIVWKGVEDEQAKRRIAFGEQYLKQLIEIEKKRGETRKKIADEIKEEELTEKEKKKALKATNDEYAERTRLYKELNAQLKTAESLRKQAEEAESMSGFSPEKRKTADFKAASEERLIQQVTERDEGAALYESDLKNFLSNLKKKKASTKDYFNYAQTALNSLSQITDGLQQIELIKFQTQQDKKQQALDDWYRENPLKEKEYNDKVQALRNESLLEEKKLKKEYANIDFGIKAAQLAATTAMGIMAAWTIVPPNPVISTALTGLIAGTGAVQLALLNEQRKSVLALNKGGRVPGVGNTDTVPAVLTPGEYVSTASATAMFLPQLEAMNRIAASGVQRPVAQSSIGLSVSDVVKIADTVFNAKPVILTNRELTTKQKRIQYTNNNIIF